MDAHALPALLTELDRDFLPHLSVNAVVFGVDTGALRVLLIQSTGTGRWALPGGYVRRDESVDGAATRITAEIAGLMNPSLRQFHTFGGLDRGEAVVADALRAMGVDTPPHHWVLGRVVSVGYVAVVNVDRAELATNPWVRAIEWHDLVDRPPLIIDHDEMVARALATVRARIDDLPLDAGLLPDAFTMPELHALHETVLGRALDRRNFQKRMLDLGLVERLPDHRVGGRRKPTFMYRWTRSSALSP